MDRNAAPVGAGASSRGEHPLSTDGQRGYESSSRPASDLRPPPAGAGAQAAETPAESFRTRSEQLRVLAEQESRPGTAETYEEKVARWNAHQAFIAACDTETIKALLDRLDRLEDVAEAAAHVDEDVLKHYDYSKHLATEDCEHGCYCGTDAVGSLRDALSRLEETQ